MRLTCPNCSAQYEVDAGMIPDDGRDVQCSNCGHTWFQMPEGQMSVPEEVTAAEESAERVAEREEDSAEITPETAGETRADHEQEPATIEPSHDETAPELESADEELVEEPVATAETTPEAVEETLPDHQEEYAAAEPGQDDSAPQHDGADEEMVEEPVPAGEPASEDAGEALADHEEEPSAVEQDHEDPWSQHDDTDGDVAEEASEPPSIEDALEAQKQAIVADAAGEDEGLQEHTDQDYGADETPDDRQPDPMPEDADAAEDNTEHPVGEPPRREVDAAVLGILREEAEREVAARREERGEVLETQTEMGLTEAAPSSPAPDYETPDEPADEAVEAPGSRSDLLPDVEEINSSLRPADQHDDGVGPDDPVVQEVNKRRGFRTGFVMIMTVAVVLVLIYLLAPQIVRAVPATEPVIVIYLNVADSARDGLDSMMARSVEGLSGLLANMSGEDAN